MTSTTFFIIFIPILAILLLAINLILAPHNPDQEKDSPFECGFDSFRAQNRTEFNISFYLVGLIFIIFDVEVIGVTPYFVSAFDIDLAGLFIMELFFALLTVGLIFEINKDALTIDSDKTSLPRKKDMPKKDTFISLILGKRVTSFLDDLGPEPEIRIETTNQKMIKKLIPIIFILGFGILMFFVFTL